MLMGETRGPWAQLLLEPLGLKGVLGMRRCPPAHCRPGPRDQGQSLSVFPLLSLSGERSLISPFPPSGIFAFKCSRAEEIFNLLQDLMQCNSINVMEEPVIVTRNSHPAELGLPRAPQPPNGEETPPRPPHLYTQAQA